MQKRMYLCEQSSCKINIPRMMRLGHINLDVNDQNWWVKVMHQGEMFRAASKYDVPLRYGYGSEHQAAGTQTRPTVGVFRFAAALSIEIWQKSIEVVAVGRENFSRVWPSAAAPRLDRPSRFFPCRVVNWPYRRGV